MKNFLHLPKKKLGNDRGQLTKIRYPRKQHIPDAARWVTPIIRVEYHVNAAKICIIEDDWLYSEEFRPRS